MHPLAVNPPEPLSQREEKLLAELEGVIETNMRGFVLVGMALAQIRDQRLYRIHYPTFEEYILRVWDMGRPRAYQLIEASEVHGNLKSFIETASDDNCSQVSLPENVHHGRHTIDQLLPKNERQARPLTLFPLEEQQAIWLQVLDEASNRGCQITANFIIQVILERQRKTIERKVKEQKERTEKAIDLPPMVKQSYQMLLQVVHDQNSTDWKQVGRQTMVSLLEDLLADLKQ